MPGWPRIFFFFLFEKKNSYLDEETVGEFHDVCLVDGGDTRATVVAGVLESILGLFFFVESVWERQKVESEFFFLSLKTRKLKKKEKKTPYHTRRGRAGDDLQRLDDSGHDLVLEARVLAWRGKGRKTNDEKRERKKKK